MQNKTIIIGVMNQKGGVGKTTAVRNIGYGLDLRGKKVLLIDADSQGSLRNWSSNSDGEIMPVIGLDTKGTLKSGIDAVKENYDIIIIDSPPKISSKDDNTTSIPEIIKVCDICLIPVKPYQDDVDSALPVVDLIESRQEINDNLRFYFIINEASKTNKSSKGANLKISEHFNLIQQPIFRKEIYPLTFPTGETIYQAIEKPKAYDSNAKSLKDTVEEFEIFLNQLTEIINEN